jgi:hypothetical protein
LVCMEHQVRVMQPHNTYVSMSHVKTSRISRHFNFQSVILLTQSANAKRRKDDSKEKLRVDVVPDKLGRWHVCHVRRLLHEYPTKVKELLFLERRVSKLSKVRAIAMYRRCYPEILGSGFWVPQPKSRPTRALTSRLSAPPHTLHTSLHLRRKSRHLPLRVHYVVLFRLRTQS